MADGILDVMKDSTSRMQLSVWPWHLKAQTAVLRTGLPAGPEPLFCIEDGYDALVSLKVWANLDDSWCLNSVHSAKPVWGWGNQGPWKLLHGSSLCLSFTGRWHSGDPFCPKSQFFSLVLTEYPVFSLTATLLLDDLAVQLHPSAFLIAISPRLFLCSHVGILECPPESQSPLAKDYLFLSFMSVASILLMHLSPCDSLLLWEKRQEEEN